MDDLSRSEYPAMLAHLQPGQAVQVLQERVRRIGKINQDIADFLQERRRVEDQYVLGLRKLGQFKVPSSSTELSVFQPSWDSILRSIDNIANSHQEFSQRVDKDVEGSLRAFQTKREMTNMNTISGNLQGMAKELDDAQSQADKLSKKGVKANTVKVDAATQRLEGANQQWDSQAPFIFETLQALDEQRINHLRDVLTQLETYEVDQASRSQLTAEAMLNIILEVRTEDEIQTFAQNTIRGRPKIEHRANTRQNSVAGSASGPPPPPLSAQSSTAQQPPPTPPASTPQQPSHSAAAAAAAASVPPPPPVPPSREATFSSFVEQPSSRPDPPEKKLRSRIGTLLSRRRQSIHGGFGQLSPSKNSGPFNRISVSSHGPSVSPRASSHNLNAEANNRLASLSETPDSPQAPGTGDARAKTPKDGATNGIGGGASRTGTGSSSGPATGGVGMADISTLNHMTVDEIFGVPPPPGPPLLQPTTATGEPARDAEGYSVPAAANDPISQAQRDAAAASSGEQLGDDPEQAFKVSIQNEPVQDEDPQAKQAALSNVANTLSLGMPTRKTGTIRGRRDVRNTIYVPAPPPVPQSSTASALTAATAATSLPSVSRSSTFGSTFGSTSTPTKPSAVAALASEGSLTGTSDTQSVRSATSLSTLAHLKHSDSANPGLNTSIIETVSASFEDGEVKTAKISGEIAFSYAAPPGSSPKPGEVKSIRINNFPLLEAIGPNRIFVQNTPVADQFLLDTSHLQQKATVGFTFRAHADNATALAAHCPLVIKPVWKPTGDKLGLLLQYRLNPQSHLAASSWQSVVLRNVVFIATYENARASGVQTKPSGTHLKDKHLVYWRMAEVSLTEAWSKIVCRVVGEQGAEPQPGHIEVRWEYLVPATGSSSAGDTDTIGLITVSQLQHQAGKNDEDEEEQDPFADISLPSPRPANGSGGASTWVDVPLTRQIVSGKYEGK